MSQKDIGRLLAELNNLIHREIIKTSQIQCDDKKGTMSQSGSCIIAYLYDHKESDVFQRDLEQEFSVRRSTMSKVLTVLEQKDLIKREDVSYDKRLKKIVLTQKAQLFADKIIDHRVELEKKLTSGITEKELKNFKATLEKLKKNLSKEEIE